MSQACHIANTRLHESTNSADGSTAIRYPVRNVAVSDQRQRVGLHKISKSDIGNKTYIHVDSATVEKRDCVHKNSSTRLSYECN